MFCDHGDDGHHGDAGRGLLVILIMELVAMTVTVKMTMMVMTGQGILMMGAHDDVDGEDQEDK